MRRGGSKGARPADAFAGLALMLLSTMISGGPALAARPDGAITPPAPQPAVRPTKASPVVTQPVQPPKATAEPAAAESERLRRVNAAKSWGYQLNGASIEALAASPYDLIVIDPTTGFMADKSLTREDVERLKKKPDGTRRLVVSYLSIGEAEDYRPDYFAKEYMEEDAPDWLLHENPDWKGNRLIQFCSEGWQKTMLGDTNGRSVYDSIRPSPVYRLVELGLDGVYLDRVDAYLDVKKQCPDGEQKMVDFVARLAAHTRKANPHFIVIQQNAEDLLLQPRLVKAIDAVAKESLFFGWGGGDGSNSIPVNSADGVKWSVDRLNKAKASGRAIFTVDYTASKPNMEQALKRSRDLGYVPYIAPKELHQLWLPGKNF
jgi:cysteinyl-tRNA synthetase, unknown class